MTALLWTLLLIILGPTLAPAQSQAPFNITLAYDQLMLSYAAYCDESQILGWNCSYCMNTSYVASFVVTAVATNSTTSTFGYVGYSGSIIQVVFRGTDNLVNLLLDLDAGHSTPYPVIPGAFVHSGFLDCWYSVKQQVTYAVNTLINSATLKPTAIYFTGHSLGAAISILAAIELGVNTGLPITCYNFGDPRVGNKAFANYFNANIQTTWRMVNQRDLVPHLPNLAMGFWHIATEVWWVNCTGYKLCSEATGEDILCSDSLGLLADSIEDHLDYMGVPLVPGRKYNCP